MLTAPALPNPVDLGFPAKFASWYNDQLVAIDKAVLTKKRFTALAMPTGSGKSVVGVAVALLHPKVTRAIYLTSTKGLQDQLSTDFQELGLTDVRGQRNYPCRALEPGGELSRYRRGSGKWVPGCDEGPCHAAVRCSLAPQRDHPSIRPGCGYYGALFDARKAGLVSTNYAMYLTGEEYAEGLGDVDLLILDEAHDADKELEAFLTLEITDDDAKAIGSKLLKTDELKTWREWAQHHHGPLAAQVEYREQTPPRDPEGAHDLKVLKRVLGKITRLTEIEPVDWVLDNDGLRARIAPLRVSRYAEQYLFRHVPHILLLSATMTRKTTQLLGIQPEDLQFWECPSRFDVARRPVISINTTPAVRVDFRMHDTTKHMWMRRIDRLIEPRRALGRKGIIHTVSYQRMKELLASSDHRDMMIVHDTGNTREMVKLFKSIRGPKILVSPSIVTGYDFPDAECRYQILGKVPQIHVDDPIMKARKDIDPEYAGYLTMQKIVQACGRGMRGPRDWCETFICDDHFADWFWNKYRKHAPKWFAEAIEYWESFPEPMEDPNV